MSNDDMTGANVALLRGINVGGKNKLPMADLAAMFREAGCDDVRTYIQSGNVVFRAGPALAGDIPSQQAHECLLRLQALDHRHSPELENGGQAIRDGRGDRAGGLRTRR